MSTQTTTISPYCYLVWKKWGAMESWSKASDILHSIWKAEDLQPSAELSGRGGDNNNFCETPPPYSRVQCLRLSNKKKMAQN